MTHKCNRCAVCGVMGQRFFRTSEVHGPPPYEGEAALRLRVQSTEAMFERWGTSVCIA